MGFAAGFQVGSQAVERAIQRQKEEELQKGLAEVYKAPTSGLSYTSDQMERMRQAQTSGAYDIEAVPGAEGQTPTLRYIPKQGLDAGDAAAVRPMEFAPQQVQIYGGQSVAGQFDPTALQGLQAREAARVVGASGDYRGAAQLQAEALRMEREARLAPLQEQALKTQVGLGNLQLETARTAREKEVGFDTAYKTHTETEFKTPEDKRDSFLKIVEQYKGPEAAQHLRASYNTNELAELNLKAARYEEDLKAARIKGPDAIITAINKLNPDLKLSRDGFTVYEESNGQKTPIIKATNAKDFALAVEARSKAGGALELANHEMQVAHNKAQTAYLEAMAHKAVSEGNANRLTNVQLGMERGPDGQLRQVMVGLQFNQKTKAYDEVRQPLTQNMIPMTALDPKTITAASEALVGTPIDPTNKSGPKHTSVTARQAVMDQIANQYLGTGKDKGGLSPDSIAAKILANQNNAPVAAPASAPATPISAPVNLGLDPNRPKAGVSSVTGQPYLQPPAAPNLVAAVGEGLDTAKANYISYLKTKIANNQPLTVDENNQAIRYKLK